MNNMMALWLEAFRKYYPNVKIQIEGKGSSTAPPALIEGTAQFGPMSRPMKSSEEDKFDRTFGYKPTPLRAALDALAVFVNKDNPIEGLTPAAGRCDFFQDPPQRVSPRYHHLGPVGVRRGLGQGPDQPLRPQTRRRAPMAFSKSRPCSKATIKTKSKSSPGSASVVQGITEDRFAIGYSGIGYRTSGVRVVPLAKAEGQEFRQGSMENVLNGSYPLGRFLYIYINKAPGQAMDPLVREFCAFIFSKEGQEIVVKDGYMPVPFEVGPSRIGQIGYLRARARDPKAI